MKSTLQTISTGFFQFLAAFVLIAELGLYSQKTPTMSLWAFFFILFHVIGTCVVLDFITYRLIDLWHKNWLSRKRY